MENPFSQVTKSTPQFHTDPLSSTHQFKTRATPFQQPKSVSSTPKKRQFNTKNLGFNTIKSVQHTRKFNTEKPSVEHKKKNEKIALYKRASQFFSESEKCVELSFFVLKWRFLVLNWRMCLIDAFLCWTEGFWDWKGVGLLCWTELGL